MKVITIEKNVINKIIVNKIILLLRNRMFSFHSVNENIDVSEIKNLYIL